MPTLHWIGKEKVINHHLDVPYRVLEHSYGFENGQQVSNETKSGNKIIHGDNLEALKALLPEYEGKIKCIYIDPPYNTGNENWVYNDNVSDPKIQKWLGQVVGKESEDLSRHDKWLCMMYPRLVLLRKLLADDGSIFVSIDDNELANLKLMMDEIFGAANFIEFFSWHKTYSPSNLSQKSKKCIEYIIAFEKKRNATRYRGLFKVNDADNPLLKSNNQKKKLIFPKDKILSNLQEDFYFESGVYGTKLNKVILHNNVQVIDGKFDSDLQLEGNFIWTQSNLESEIAKGTLIKFKGKSLAPRYDKANYDPEVPRNLIGAEDQVGTTEEGGIILKQIFGERNFDYPKPPSLIQYILNFVTEKDSVVLDSFAGSGTTAHAVAKLNKADGGDRKFILVEREDYADAITSERVKRVIDGYGDTEGTGGTFDYYELGHPLFTEDDQLNELVGIPAIRNYIYFSETRQYLATASLKDNDYFLNQWEGNSYYFFYEQDQITTLDHKFLSTIKNRAEKYIVYADRCLLTKEFMNEKGIIFKKIPRDINKF